MLELNYTTILLLYTAGYLTCLLLQKIYFRRKGEAYFSFSNSILFSLFSWVGVIVVGVSLLNTINLLPTYWNDWYKK